jgi:ketosteroid isomerase-like protein
VVIEGRETQIYAKEPAGGWALVHVSPPEPKPEFLKLRIRKMNKRKPK